MLNLDQLEKKTFRASLQDGLMDLGTGVYILVLAGILKIHTMIGLVAILILFFPVLVIYLRKRYTYPRIGYVQFKKESMGKFGRTVLISLVIGLIALLVTLAISGDIGTAREWYKWMPVLFGIVFAGIFIGMWTMSGLFRYMFYSAISLVFGFLFPFVPEGPGASFPYLQVFERLDNIAFLLFFLSIVLILCGLAVFIHFLNANPIVKEGDNNEK